MEVSVVHDEVTIHGSTASVFSKPRIERILLALAVLADRVEHTHGARTYYAGNVALAVYFDYRANHNLPHLICSRDLV